MHFRIRSLNAFRSSGECPTRRRIGYPMKVRYLRSLLGATSLMVLTATAHATEVYPLTQPSGVSQRAGHVEQQEFRRLVSDAAGMPSEVGETLELTLFDIESIRAHNQKTGNGVPERIGMVKPLAVNVDFGWLSPGWLRNRMMRYARGGVRRTEDGQLVWAIPLETFNASAARLRFSKVRLPPGAEIFIYNEIGDVRGPYTGDGEAFWSHSIGGEQLYVQVRYPQANAPAMRKIRFRIDAVMLASPDTQDFCDFNASCIEDASCYDESDWSEIDQARKAVALIRFIDGPFAYSCSGALLNDTDDASLIPYFLTAHHCVGSEGVAQTVETFFAFRTQTCGAPCYSPDTPSTIGATLLNTSAVSDHALLRLGQQPPDGSVYLGWTDEAVSANDGEILYRISHPKGGPQAFTEQTVDINAPSCVGFSRDRYIYSRAVLGSSEGGSSGSPVINAFGQVVGQLYGQCGTALSDVCDIERNALVDGAFASYYPEVAQWLDPSIEQPPPDPACPATATLQGQPERESWLTLLRGFRDHHLGSSAADAWMVEAYYRHAPEVSRRLLGSRTMRAQALSLLHLLKPKLAAAARGEPLALGKSTRARLARFARSLKWGVSDDLRVTLERFLGRLESMP